MKHHAKEYLSRAYSHGRDDEFVVFMLQFHQFFLQEPRVIVINEGHGSNHEHLADPGLALIQTKNRATACSFQATPVPITPSTTAIPCSTRSGSARIGFHQSAYSR